jgi:hypothetical protein
MAGRRVLTVAAGLAATLAAGLVAGAVNLGVLHLAGKPVGPIGLRPGVVVTAPSPDGPPSSSAGASMRTKGPGPRSTLNEAPDD